MDISYQKGKKDLALQILDKIMQGATLGEIKRYVEQWYDEEYIRMIDRRTGEVRETQSFRMKGEFKNVIKDYVKYWRDLGINPDIVIESNSEEIQKEMEEYVRGL